MADRPVHSPKWPPGMPVTIHSYPTLYSACQNPLWQTINMGGAIHCRTRPTAKLLRPQRVPTAVNPLFLATLNPLDHHLTPQTRGTEGKKGGNGTPNACTCVLRVCGGVRTARSCAHRRHGTRSQAPHGPGTWCSSPPAVSLVAAEAAPDSPTHS